MKLRLWHSLRSRVATTMFVVALLPTLLLSWVNYRATRDSLRQTAAASLRSSALRSAGELDALTTRTLDYVRTLALLDAVVDYAGAAPAARPQYAAEVRRLLLMARRFDDVYASAVAVVDTNGVQLLNDRGSAARGRWALDELEPALRSGFPMMSNVIWTTDAGGSARLEAAAPVVVRERTVAFVTLRFKATVLESVLQAQRNTADGERIAWLNDQAHVRLAGGTEAVPLLTGVQHFAPALQDSLQRSGRLRSVIPSVQVRRAIGNTRTYPDSTAVFGVTETFGTDSTHTLLGATARMRTKPWVVYIAMPLAAALQPARALLLQAVEVAFSIAVLVALLALVAGRRLAAPIDDLSEQARRFTAGDYTARVSIGPAREIAGLGRAFNDLAERVGTLVTSLAERTRELEADIKERERLETELLHARQLEAIGRLAGGVAHDFNNLLTVVLSNLSFIEEGLPDGSPLGQEVQAAREASTRGAALTSQLLAFSRRGLIEARVFDVGSTLRGMQVLLQRLVGDLVEMTLSVDDGLWPVTIDPTQWNQVVTNLAANARDAMPRGGALSISARNITITAETLGLAPGEYVELQVRDAGQGMTPDTVARAFEPFFTTKDVGRGTGLGLATVYGIVTRANGSVHIESVPNEGTSFFVRLPRSPGAANAGDCPDAASETRLTGTETILLAEDNELVRASTARTLRDLGYSVLDARDGLEAIDQLASASRIVHLVVTDVLMPRLDGVALARRLRTSHPGLPVLFLSGNPPEEMADLVATGEFLAKPFSHEELAKRVRALLEQRR